MLFSVGGGGLQHIDSHSSLASNRQIRHQGITLVEILVAVVLMVCFTGAAWFFFASTRANDLESEKEQAYQQRRAILEGLVRGDLRAATHFEQVTVDHWKLRVLFLDDAGVPGERSVEYLYDPAALEITRRVDGVEQRHSFVDCAPDGQFQFQLTPVNP